MSVVEDVRKIIQDLVSPDLKAIAAKVDAMEAISVARHNELLARIEAVESKIETSSTIHTARYEAIMKALDIDKRLEKVEARQSSVA